MKKKDYLYLSALISIVILAISFLLCTNQIFGYEVDWLSQHSVIPDYFRQLFYESGNFFPDYAPHIGSGMNIYTLSYYGLFRIDTLIAYVLPFIAMKDIIISYMIFLIILGSLLNYIWLKKNQFSSTICFVCSVLLICSSFFFQSHRQIMFVNYLPFILLAFLSIDYYLKKKKITYLILSILLIILHSYFFSISAIIVCIIYYLFQLNTTNKKGWKTNKKHIATFGFAIIISILIAAILLIPTAFVILEHTKDVKTLSFDQVLGLNLDLKALLYSGYGCGFTIIAYIAIIFGVFQSKTKYLSIILLICFTFPFIAYLLNGTLYARTKIVITFIPLVLFLIAKMLQNIRKNTNHYHPVMIPLLLLPVVFITKNNELVLLDLLITLLILFIYQKYNNRSVLLLCIIPILFLARTNTSSTFLNQDFYNKVIDSDKKTLLESNQLIGRSDDLSDPLANTNRVYTTKQYKTSSYTSTTNTLYNKFYFDVMRNPISIVNRVAQPSKNNIIFQSYMGVNTLLSNTSIPIGYEVINQKNHYKLLQNKNVLPIAYASDLLINEKVFDQLSYPYTLDTIFNNSIVEGKGNSNYKSQMKHINLDFNSITQSKHLTIQREGNEYLINSKKNGSLVLDLNNDLNNQILLINFNLKDITKKETRNTSIKINGILNKLSKETANYPNHNDQFTYILSSQEAITQLKIEFSKGSYTIDDLQVHTLDYSNLLNRMNQIVPLSFHKTNHNEVLNGSIKTEKKSYFITTLPYQKGYRAFINNKEVDISLVNKAFVGFKLPAGDHQIKIVFEAPGKKMGMVLSFIGTGLLILIIGFERNKKDAK